MKVFCFPLFFSILFLSGLAQAQILNPCDQNGINQALESDSTVYLNPGVYEITGPIYIHSNTVLTGSPDAIIRVSSSSSQWFTGSTGIISSDGVLNNVEISGFQIDGNVENLPPEYHHSRSDTAHDCENLIRLQGESNNFMNNISIKDMKLYDSFGDGCHIIFCNHAEIYNNFISNTQHEGVFLVCGIDSRIYNNQIAGITSDCLRADNSINCEIFNNICFSYNGSHASNTYMHGESGLQLGDGSVSHGYDARNKPTSTKNIYVHDNTFVNNGLQAIVLDSVALSESANVIVQKNKIIGHDDFVKSGVPFDIDNYSYENPPTLQQSEQVFSSIFNILNAQLSDSGYVTQSNIFQPNKTWINQGDTSAWIDCIGYTGEIKIGNDTYIPKPANECALILTGTQSSKSRVVGQESSKKLSVGTDNNLTVNLEVRTRYEVPEKHKITVLGQSINYTTYKQVSENATFTKAFKAPSIFPAFNAPNVSVIYFNGFHAVVSVPDLPGIVKIDYSYNNSSCSEYRLVGYIGSATNGFKSTEYKPIETFLTDNSGRMSRSPEGLYIKGKFDISKLNVTVITPYDTFHITHFQYTVIENDFMKFFKWQFIGLLGFFVIYGRAIYKVIWSVIGKWI